jgi:4'-phosphopantetheinyl transferase
MGPLTIAAAKVWSGSFIGPVPAAGVHLWMVPLDVPIGDSRLFLDAADLARAAGYLRPADGARFAASRAGLRRLLASYLDADPARFRFRPDRTGRPAVAVRAPAGDRTADEARDCDSASGDQEADDDVELVPGVEFSLSRTEDVALIAVSAVAVGADIEREAPRPGLADLVAARFPPREAACLAGGCSLPARPGDPALRGFYRHWTAREAYLKAIGYGLAGLRRVEVTCCPRPEIRIGGVLADGWQLSFPAVSSAHTAAVVARHPVTRCCWLPPQAR